jgi:hypothetical protein
MSAPDLVFQKPTELRDRFRNLGAVVEIALNTGEDPIVLASASGVSPSALVRALPRAYLAQFVPDAEAMSYQEILLALAANHALDAAVEGLVSGAVDVKSTLVTARDVMDRVSLMTAKKSTAPRRLSLTNETITKFLELEKVFTEQGLTNGQIAPEFSAFVQTKTRSAGDGTESQKDAGQEDERLARAARHEAWARKPEPEIRELLNLNDD